MKTQDVKLYAAQQLHRLQSLPDNQRRAELAKLHLFGAEHCEPNSGEQDFTGRVLILSPDTLRESYWQPENQLWLAPVSYTHLRAHET